MERWDAHDGVEAGRRGGEIQSTTAIRTRFHHTGSTPDNFHAAFQLSTFCLSVMCPAHCY